MLCLFTLVELLLCVVTGVEEGWDLLTWVFACVLTLPWVVALLWVVAGL